MPKINNQGKAVVIWFPHIQIPLIQSPDEMESIGNWDSVSHWHPPLPFIESSESLVDPSRVNQRLGLRCPSRDGSTTCFPFGKTQYFSLSFGEFRRWGRPPNTTLTYDGSVAAITLHSNLGIQPPFPSLTLFLIGFYIAEHTIWALRDILYSACGRHIAGTLLTKL